MPMVKCTGCGSKVSTMALSCPKCGTPVVVQPGGDRGMSASTIVALVVFGVVLGVAVYLYLS